MGNSSRIIDGLKTNTSYSFYIRAKNTIGVWSDLPTVVTHTTLKDTTAAASPSGFTVAVALDKFLFNWTLGSEVDLRGGGYKLYVYTANTSASAKLIKQFAYPAEAGLVTIGEMTDDTSITLTAGTTYWWWLTSLDDSGNESAKAASTPTSIATSVKFSRGGTILSPTGATNVIVWNAPFACTVIAVKGYRSSGTGATVNARRNGTSNHLSSDLSVSSTDTWMDGGAVQNTAYVVNDKLEIMLTSITGLPTQVGIQVDLMRV